MNPIERFLNERIAPNVSFMWPCPAKDCTTVIHARTESKLRKKQYRHLLRDEDHTRLLSDEILKS